MSLGLSAYHNNGNDFEPRVEYNAKAGRMHIVNRAQGADGAFASDKIDITMSKPVFALDIGSVEVGWAHFPPGAGPQMDMVPYGEPMPARPDRIYKAGFKLQLWDGREPNARRFMSTAAVVVEAIEQLWDEAIAASQAATGDIPIVQLVNVRPVSGRHGTNYAPEFRLIKWVTRDERIFGPRTVAPPRVPAAPPRQPAQPARSAATRMNPPPTRYAPPDWHDEPPANRWDDAPPALVNASGWDDSEIPF
jgi:hypothetical protein